mmetsp:Transcript_94287/g.271692  ORF Transcript_94287/g.271692 Transcript_94287/m.271692 type:complete len:144 (-) Transcript_94287:202-633(-)
MFCCCGIEDGLTAEVVTQPSPHSPAQEASPREKAAPDTHAGPRVSSSDPTTFYIQVEKTPSEQIGLDVVGVGQNLRVQRISPGLVQKWNEQHPDRAVQTGDLIVEVNGTVGGGTNALAGQAFAPLLQAIKEGTGLRIGCYRRS